MKTRPPDPWKPDVYQLALAPECVTEASPTYRPIWQLKPTLSLSIITLYDGERYEGIPGQANFRTVKFAENVIPVRLPELSRSSATLDAATSTSLRGAAQSDKRA